MCKSVCGSDFVTGLSRPVRAGRGIDESGIGAASLPGPFVGTTAVHPVEMGRRLLASTGIAELLAAAMLRSGGTGTIVRRREIVVVAELKVA